MLRNEILAAFLALFALAAAVVILSFFLGGYGLLFGCILAVGLLASAPEGQGRQAQE